MSKRDDRSEAEEAADSATDGAAADTVEDEAAEATADEIDAVAAAVTETETGPTSQNATFFHFLFSA